ncbi:hypothetical protein HNR19_002433 [Nocardioides thalensis]|uniref:Uncharacterized protein n=1 Tax=Nocardioides thalensis TaxID=1914755 RepID=A0A853C278_9ACTN|nr:hypothetical protein [Nocardioides thalensis]
MSEGLATCLPLLAFMLTPLWIPLAVALVGAVFDLFSSHGMPRRAARPATQRQETETS